MLNFLLNLDIYLFRLINNVLINPLFDKFFPFITEVDSWILLYIIGFWYLFFKSGKIGKLTAVTLIITIIVSDQFSSTFLKEWVGRIRPCHVLDNVRLLVDCGGGKSFPSSHAVNNFAAAFVITYFFKKNYILFYLIAFLMAYSRVYVGVHYPSDVIIGAIIGIIIGFLITKLTTKFEQLISKKNIKFAFKKSKD